MSTHLLRVVALASLYPLLLLGCGSESSETSSQRKDSAAASVMVDNGPQSAHFGSDSVGWTEQRLREIRYGLLMFRDSSRRFPDSLAEIIPSPPDVTLAESYRYDAWGTPIRYKHRGDSTFEIRSAGSDRVFGTRDDLYMMSKTHQPM